MFFRFLLESLLIEFGAGLYNSREGLGEVLGNAFCACANESAVQRLKLLQESSFLCNNSQFVMFLLVFIHSFN